MIGSIATRGQAGTGLIEVLVAASLSLAIATAGFYFLSAQNGMGARGTDLMKGLNLGKLAIDSLKVSSYDGLASGSDTLGGRYIRSWNVAPIRDDGGNPTGRKKIELNVYWPLTAHHTVGFTTVVGDDRYKEE